MSEKNVLSDRCTVSDKKSATLINKENMYEVVHSGKFFDSKTDGCKKKGLSLKAENYTTGTTPGSSTSTSIGKFPIYVDDETASNRSRSRVRKNVCRKEIRAKQDSKTLANTNLLSTKALEVQSNLDLRVVHRAISESRNMSSWAHYDVQTGSRQIKLVSNDVKKRTFSSIQTWKDKMRRSHTSTIPKYEVNKMQNKIKLLRKSYDVESVDFQIEKSINVQNQAANKDVKKLKSQNCLLNTVKAMPFEFMEIKKDVLNNSIVEIDVSPRSSLKNNSVKKESSTISDNFNAVKPSSCLVSRMTPIKVNKKSTNNTKVYIALHIYYKIITVLVFIIVYINTIFGNVVKVRHEKCSTMKKPLHQKKINIFEKIDGNDYLDFALNTEREREKNAPTLSIRFLRENVNAEQRRFIVGFMIQLGVKCNYSSGVIYQTIKLFNGAIDKILVEIDHIQLIALACLWIIVKHEVPEAKIPTATDILKYAKDMYTNTEKKALSQYEKKILFVVNFRILFANPFSLLSYYILTLNRDCACNIIKPNDIPHIYFCGSYMIDLSMLDESLCEIPTYVIAIAAMEISLCLVYLNNDNVDEVFIQTFRSKQLLTVLEKVVINSTRQVMIQRSLERDKFYSKVIYKKYLRSEYDKVSDFIYAQVNDLKERRSKHFLLNY
ncbi:hypothetical protein PUN28_009709 [Cardiocondyla obscurior]|uniref:Cyclin N-terminal domain-containing protein n=1 Tax=Cardiocondyla obscurior TaxID=286306 RepID=A0AAW2FVU5_9HYME